MAENSWPFHDGTSGTPVLEDQWSIMARAWALSGVIDTGNKLSVYTDGGANREVKVSSGRATVRGHWYENTSALAVTLDANSSGNPRIDRIVLRLNPSANSIVVAVVKGTPAGSPSAPALTQTDVGTFEMTLARVTVANGATTITSGNITDERTYCSLPVTPATSANRPTSPVTGQTIMETDTGRVVYYNGSGWVTVKASPAETWTSWTPTISNVGTATNVTGFYIRSGDVVHWSLSFTTGATAGSSTVTISKPADGYSPINGTWVCTDGLASSAILDTGQIVYTLGGFAMLGVYLDGVTTPSMLTASNVGSTRTFYLSGTYKAA